MVKEDKEPNCVRLAVATLIIFAITAAVMLAETILGVIEWKRWGEVWRMIWQRLSR